MTQLPGSGTGKSDDSSHAINGFSDSESEGKRQELLVAQPPEGFSLSPVPNVGGLINDDDDHELNVDDSSESFFPAIVTLDALNREGKITAIQMTHLKHKFFQLCSLLSKTRDNEFSLLQISKNWTNDLDGLDKILAKADNYPENFNTKADALRKQLLTAENQVLEIDARNDELFYVVRSLEEEKRMLQKELDRLPNKEETEENYHILERSIEELKSEIAKRSGETRQLNQTLKDSQATLNDMAKRVDEARSEIESLKATITESASKPLHYAMESDKILKQKEEAERLKSESITELTKLKAELEDLEQCRVQLDLEGAKLSTQSAKRQRKIYDLQCRIDAVNIHIEKCQQQTAEFNLQKAESELKLEHMKSQLVRLEEQIKRFTHERDHMIRVARKAENSLQSMKDSVKFATQNCEEVRSAYETMKENKSDVSLNEKRQKLAIQIKTLQESLIKQSELSESEIMNLRRTLKKQDELNYEIADLRIELVELSRLATIKADEREQKSRDFRMAQTRYTRIREDIKTKKLQTQDYEKSLHDTQRYLNNFAKLYDKIKDERNSCLNLIQFARQRTQELKEKMKILNNEADILQNAFNHKHDLLLKQRGKHEAFVVIRDKLRNQISKTSSIIQEQELKKTQLENSIERQNQMIKQNLKHLNAMKESIGLVIQLRNNRAIEIVERNDEVCVMQEKLNLITNTYQRGELELNKLNVQFEWLNQTKQELERSVEIYKKKLENQDKLSNQLACNQIQLMACQDRVIKLEQHAMNPQNPIIDDETGSPLQRFLSKKHEQSNTGQLVLVPRANEIPGRDLDPAELYKKIDSIQVRMINQEYKLLELTLLLDCIDRLVEKLTNHANLEKDTVLQIALKTNEQKHATLKSTRRLKATTAELTMLMATAFHLEQQVQQMKDYLAECYRRVEAGEAPTDDALAQWVLYVKTLKWKSMKTGEYKELDPYEYWTTAPERPNAYLVEKSISPAINIKQDFHQPPPSLSSRQDIAKIPTKLVAVPYGVQAPFEPTELGSNMRHFRKPKQLDL